MIHGNCVFSTLNYTKYIIFVILLFCTIYIFCITLWKKEEEEEEEEEERLFLRTDLRNSIER